MTNPWTYLPENAPHVISEDLAPLLEWNKRAKPVHEYHLDLLPDPYIGHLSAPVIMLALNPGYSEEDHQTHLDPAFRDRALVNLRQGDQPYPFYYLDPELPGGGRPFWENKLRALIEHFGREHVSDNVTCLQFHPYHSREYRPSRLSLPSQQFTFDALRTAIRRDAMVVALRSWGHWVREVPELEEHGRVVRLRSPRNPTVSPRNCGEGFAQIIAALE